MAEHWASYSALGTHRACPQKYNYAYLERLVKVDPEDVRVELEFGLWWHALRAADSIERGRRHGSLRWTQEFVNTVDDGPKIRIEDTENLVDAVMAASVTWWENLRPETQKVWHERLGWDNLLQGLEHIDSEYRMRWASESGHEHPVAVELHWRRDLPTLPDPTGGRIEPETVMTGYVDEVYLDTRRNLLVVRDHKTHKTLGTQSSVDDMMDSQLQVYAWGAAPTVGEWDLGPIRAVAYDRVRSQRSKTPRVTQTGGLSAAVKDFDLRTYLQWCATRPEYPGRFKDGSGAGVYEVDENVVANLSTEVARSAWFQRTLTPLNPNIVKTHLRAAVDTAMDIRATKDRAKATGEAGRNLSGSCRWCDFAGLCRAQMIGGPDGEYELADYALAKK